MLLAGPASLTRVDARTGKALGEPVALPPNVHAVGVVPSADGTSAVLLIAEPWAPAVSVHNGSRIGRVEQRGEVTGVAFAPDGRQVVSGGREGAALLWDVPSWTVRHSYLGHVGQVTAVAFDPRGTHVATASVDGTARVWPTVGNAAPLQLSGHTNYVNDVAFGDAGSVVTASTDGTARTWDASGRQVHVLVGHGGAVQRAAFAWPAVVITSGVDGTVRIWDSGVAPDSSSLR